MRYVSKILKALALLREAREELAEVSLSNELWMSRIQIPSTGSAMQHALDDLIDECWAAHRDLIRSIEQAIDNIMRHLYAVMRCGYEAIDKWSKILEKRCKENG